MSDDNEDEFKAKSKQKVSLVVAGPTGSGKSRILEVLGVNKTISAIDPIRGSSNVLRHDSVVDSTIHNKIFTFDIIDTVGLGDSEFSVKQILVWITKEMINMDINTVLLVFKFNSRITTSFKKDVEDLISMFKSINVIDDQFIITYTHCDGVKREHLEEYKSKLINKIPGLKEIKRNLFLSLPDPKLYDPLWLDSTSVMLMQSKDELLKMLQEQKLSRRVDIDASNRIMKDIENPERSTELKMIKATTKVDNVIEEIGNKIQIVHKGDSKNMYIILTVLICVTSIIITLIFKTDKVDSWISRIFKP